MLHKYLAGALVFLFLGAGLAHASLDDYLSSLRISASADFGAFRAGLGAHYGASGAELDHLFLSVKDPGDAALCFWLARKSGHPVDYVVDRYHKNKGKGWGALAQSLGIKPGSAEFKALKNGDIGWDPPNKHKGGKGNDDKDSKNHKEKEHGGKDKSGGKGKSHQ